MWSQPDIQALNRAAAITARKMHTAVESKQLDGVSIGCEACEWDSKETQAAYVEEWFDIFSDDPKGVIGLCNKHMDEHGFASLEGYFLCDHCNRMFITNYTWEYYFADDEESGERFCLPCYAEVQINRPENWIHLNGLNFIGLNTIDELGFDRVIKSKHLIGVDMPVPKEIEYVDGVTLDGYSGGVVRGSSTSDDTPDAGVEELKVILKKMRKEGEEEALLILDAGYQFAVHIGIYKRS